jgi:acetyltransferase-like isoleucine patch superfamily enzyme
MKRKRWKLHRLGARFFKKLERNYTEVNLHRLTCNGRLKIGKHSYGYPIVKLFSDSVDNISIGSFCSIASGVTFIVGNGEHRPEWVSTFPFRSEFKLNKGLKKKSSSVGDIVVGSDVWIATDALILPGVKIGHGAIVAARSVVAHDVPPYAIVAGVPAVVKRFRFDENIISRLLKLSWWEWEDEQIIEAIPFLCSDDIELFLQRYEL